LEDLTAEGSVEYGVLRVGEPDGGNGEITQSYAKVRRLPEENNC